MRYMIFAGLLAIVVASASATLRGEEGWRQERGIGIGTIPAFYIQGIYRESPADQAGLEPGDIIFKVDGKDFVQVMFESGPRALRDLVGEKEVGETIALTLLRLNPETQEFEKHTKTVEIGYYGYRVGENKEINMEDYKQ